MRRAAIYARISLDRRDGEGVARQLADCRQLAAAKGWDLAGEYVDNDLSAFRAKRRPEWVRLLEDLNSGVVDALVAYHPDRTYRLLKDLESLIDVVEQTGAEVATVKAGDVDLTTATGRMQARIIAAVNRHESERIGERVSRAKAERATQGRPPGGGFRAFGWADDKITLIPAEAAVLRVAALAVAAGGSMGEQARELNRQGFTTTAGRQWDTASLRRVLTSARIAGLRSYRGEVVGPAAWPAIVDEPTWRRLVVMTEGRKRGRVTSGKSLLSTLIACPKCGRSLYYNGNGAYSCHPGTRQGCGGASISQQVADAKVTAAIDDYLNDPAEVLANLDEQPLDRTAEIDAIEAKRVELARRWALDQITTDAYDEARTILERRLDALGQDQTPRANVDLEKLRRAWATGTVLLRRNVVVALLETPIPLTAGRMPNPADRLRLTFR